MVRTANFVKRFNEGILVVGLKGNPEVDRGAVRGSTQMFPVVRVDIPKVLDTHVTPMRCKRRPKSCEGDGG